MDSFKTYHTPSMIASMSVLLGVATDTSIGAEGGCRRSTTFVRSRAYDYAEEPGRTYHVIKEGGNHAMGMNMCIVEGSSKAGRPWTRVKVGRENGALSVRR